MILDRTEDKYMEWNVSYSYYQYGKLDWLICYQVPSFKDVPFPVLENEIAQQLVANNQKSDRMKRMDRCRLFMQNWIHEVLDRTASFPLETREIVYKFFRLPSGPVTGEPAFEFPPTSSLKPAR